MVRSRARDTVCFKLSVPFCNVFLCGREEAFSSNCLTLFMKQRVHICRTVFHRGSLLPAEANAEESRAG